MLRIIKIIRRGKKGFTIIELSVAMAIFSLVIGSIMGIFIAGVRSQGKILVTQKLLDETSYVIEYMSRTIRMAKDDVPGTCLAPGVNYQASEGEILFVDYKRECTRLYRDDATYPYALYKEIAGTDPEPITSNDFELASFNVKLSGESATDIKQSRVTISMILKKAGVGKPEIKIQTTISRRDLETY